MLSKNFMLNCFEKPTVIILLCVIDVCIFTSIDAIEVQMSKHPGGAVMHYPSKQSDSSSVLLNITSIGPVLPVSPVDQSVMHNAPAPVANMTGVCATGPCLNVGGNVDSRLKTNPLQSVSTNLTGNYSVFPHSEKGSSRKWNPEALMRGSYVFLGLSAIVIVYIIWKSMGRKKSQVHRYGVIPNNEDMELSHIDSEEGEDDTTHFDLSVHRTK